MSHILNQTGDIWETKFSLELLQESIQASKGVYKRPEKKELLNLLKKVEEIVNGIKRITITHKR